MDRKIHSGDQIESGKLEVNIVKKVGSAFTGGSANTHGDSAGTGNPYTLFTVTGDVKVNVYGICNTILAGASATLEVGVASDTAILIAQTTATDIDADEAWTSATVTPGALTTAYKVIVNGADIIETVGTADITSGQMDYYCEWIPLEAGASVVAV